MYFQPDIYGVKCVCGGD